MTQVTEQNRQSQEENAKIQMIFRLENNIVK